LSRLKTRLDHKKIRRLIWLVLTVFVLLGYSLQSVAGSAYYSMLMQAHGTVTSPPVILEEGNCSGTSTIYTNKTSAKVSVVAPRNWWNMGYGYRRRISIVNNVASNLGSGYSVCLTVNTASLVSSGKMLSSGNDLRILYGNGSSWVEIDRDTIDMNTSSTKVWFKTQAEIDSSATDKNYYMYYGNPSAGSPPADKSEVYLWFDDFSTNTTNNYNVDRHANDWHGNASNVYKPYWDSAKSAVYFDTGNDYVGGWMPNAINETNVYAEMKMNITGSYPTNTTNGILLRWQNKDTFYGGHISGGSYTSPCLVRNGRTTYIAYKSPSEYHAWNQWFTFAVAVWSSNLKLWVDGILKVNGTDTQITAPGKVSFLVSQSIGWMDDFKIRKYVEPEPSTSLGSEESNIQDYVDNNTSNVDSSADKGTHSNFTAQQYGPDSTYDTLTEGNTGSVSNTTLINAESFEGTWPPTGWTETNDWDKELDQAYHGTYSADFDGSTSYPSGDLTTPDLDCSGVSAIYVDFWYRDDDLDTDDFLLRYYDGSAWDTISDLGSTTQEDQWLNYREKITDSQYFVSTFKLRWSGVSVYSGEAAWVDLVTVKKEVGTYNYELDLEVQWTNADYDETNEELAIYVNKENTHSLNATGGYMIVGSGTPNWGSATGTISFWIKWDNVGNRPWGQHDNMETRFSGQNLVVDWGAAGSLTSSTSFTNGTWYFIAIVWNENTLKLRLYVGDQNNPPTLDNQNTAWTSRVSTAGVTQNNFMASKGGVEPTDGRGDDLRYWNIDRTLAEIQSDYDTELTGSETNLRSYFKLNNNFDDVGPNNNDGSGSGSYSFSSDVPFEIPLIEKIRVDVWNGTAWQNLFTNLTSGWNNVLVSSYLNSSTFTIRFKGGTETGDTNKDSWNIDATLLHVWTIEETYDYNYVLKVVNQIANNWTVNLKVYDSATINRLSSLNISLHDVTSSNQIAVSGGSIVKSEGPPYNLAGNATIYISISNLQATTTGTSYLYVYLKIQVPNISTYILYVITFEIN